MRSTLLECLLFLLDKYVCSFKDKMEIKRDAYGMVIVPGAELVQAIDYSQLKDTFLKGNSNRHIASTSLFHDIVIGSYSINARNEF